MLNIYLMIKYIEIDTQIIFFSPKFNPNVQYNPDALVLGRDCVPKKNVLFCHWAVNSKRM